MGKWVEYGHDKAQKKKNGKSKLEVKIKVKKRRLKKQYGPKTVKRLASEAVGENWASPETKKKKLSGQMEVTILSSPRAKQKLKMETNEHEDNEIGELDLW